MMTDFTNSFSRSNNPEDEIPAVESYLHSTFRPVSPRPDFVSTLKARLSDRSRVLPSRESAYYVLALIVVAVTTLSLILIWVIRVLSELLANIRVVR